MATRQARDVFNATNLVVGASRAIRRRQPSLKHSLVQRHAMIDYLLGASGSPQVLELAAGLSPRGTTFSRDPGLDYVELDLPAMVDKKRELLSRSHAGRAVLARDNFRLVAGDANEVALDSLIDAGLPVSVISEGLLMYLDADEQRRLWSRIAALVARVPGSAYTFDLVPACEQPPPGVIGRSLGFLFKRATGGRGFSFDDRSRADLAGELRDCGFDRVDIHEPADIASAWGIPFANKRTQVLVWHCRAT